MEFLDGVSVCDQNGNKMEKSGTQRQKKTIWTKVANLDKTQGLKWQFTQKTIKSLHDGCKGHLYVFF
ncbi:hypothetical protein Hanom_Chr10g00903931 [Helianthus anomalus]